MKTVFISNGKAFDHKGEPVEVKVTKSAEPTGTALPDNFPHRTHVIAKFPTVESLKGVTKEQLVALDNIGPKSADEILAFLK